MNSGNIDLTVSVSFFLIAFGSSACVHLLCAVSGPHDLQPVESGPSDQSKSIFYLTQIGI